MVAGGFGENGEPVSAVEVYKTGAARWVRGPDLPAAVHHAMAASDGEMVYVIGGYTSGGFSQPGDRAFVLRDDGWSELPRLPEPRAAAGAAVIDGRLYVAGGVGPAGLATQMMVFDLDEQRWLARPGPPTAREHLGVAAADGLLYVIGGRTGGLDTNVAAAEVFDPATRTWTALEPMPTARGGIAAAATANGYIVVPGGEQPGGTFATVEAFNVGRGRWRRLPALPTPRHGLGIATIDSVVYVIQGGPRPGLTFSSANESLDLSGRATE